MPVPLTITSTFVAFKKLKCHCVLPLGSLKSPSSLEDTSVCSQADLCPPLPHVLGALWFSCGCHCQGEVCQGTGAGGTGWVWLFIPLITESSAPQICIFFFTASVMYIKTSIYFFCRHFCSYFFYFSKTLMPGPAQTNSTTITG